MKQNRINLDRSKLFGFKLEAAARPAGGKTSAKLGSKLGVKLGAKPAIKPV